MQQNEVFIDSIEIPSTLIEEYLGLINNAKGNIGVYINPSSDGGRSEGPIAHFHLKGENFENCICIYEPKYFDHNGKFSDELSAKQIKYLIKWLQSTCKKDHSKTNWEYLKYYWETYDSVTEAQKNI